MNSILNKKLTEGVINGVFPAAEAIGCKSGKIVWHEKVGSIENENKVFFDLASLTKPLCTALLALIFNQQKSLSLESTIADFLPTSTLQNVTIRSLLNHTSGLIAWAPLYADKISMKNPDYNNNHAVILNVILNDDYFFQHPGKTVYSDVGYIILGAILEKIGGKSLDKLFYDHLSGPLNLANDIFFVPLGNPSTHNQSQFVASERCPFRGRLIQGEVMDKNCFAMGGVTGHAGLFATANAVHFLLNELRRARSGTSAIFQKSDFDLFCLPDRNRKWHERCFTLGFDTPTQGVSQSGKYFSKNSIGHLGYSGTSFWWDLDNDLWIVLLTNRCLPHRTSLMMQTYRPELHDLAYQEILKIN